MGDPCWSTMLRRMAQTFPSPWLVTAKVQQHEIWKSLIPMFLGFE